MIQIYVDGSCPIPNAVGGWAYVMLLEPEPITSSGYGLRETNNTMELTAALMALREVKAQKLRAEPIKIISDSQLLVNGMNKWRHEWIKFNFEGIKNADLWARLTAHAERCEALTFEWVKGHSGNHWNEWVDRAAAKAQRLAMREHA